MLPFNTRLALARTQKVPLRAWIRALRCTEEQATAARSLLRMQAVSTPTGIPRYKGLPDTQGAIVSPLATQLCALVEQLKPGGAAAFQKEVGLDEDAAIRLAGRRSAFGSLRELGETLGGEPAGRLAQLLRQADAIGLLGGGGGEAGVMEAPLVHGLPDCGHVAGGILAALEPTGAMARDHHLLSRVGLSAGATQAIVEALLIQPLRSLRELASLPAVTAESIGRLLSFADQQRLYRPGPPLQTARPTPGNDFAGGYS